MSTTTSGSLMEMRAGFLFEPAHHGLDAVGQGQVLHAQAGFGGQLAQIHLDELGSWAACRSRPAKIAPAGSRCNPRPSRRGLVSAFKVQWHFQVDAGGGVHALEVHVQHQLFEGWNCTSRSTTLLVWPFSSMSRMLEWPGLFLQGATVRCGPARWLGVLWPAPYIDTGGTASVAQTAARTRTLLGAPHKRRIA